MSLYNPLFTSVHSLSTSTHPSVHLLVPPYTPPCTSVPPTPLHIPLCTSAHLHVPLHTCPCTSAHPHTPPYTSPHLYTPLCTPCIPLCTLCSFVHLHQPLHTPICAPLHASTHLCAPPCTPVHKSHWIRELPQPIRSLVLNNLINIKC